MVEIQPAIFFLRTPSGNVMPHLSRSLSCYSVKSGGRRPVYADVAHRYITCHSDHRYKHDREKRIRMNPDIPEERGEKRRGEIKRRGRKGAGERRDRG